MDFLKTWTSSPDTEASNNSDQQNEQNQHKTTSDMPKSAYVTSTGLEIHQRNRHGLGHCQNHGSGESLSKQSDGSDYVLDSDDNDSPACGSPISHTDEACDVNTTAPVTEYYSQYAKNVGSTSTLKKTGSTGDLRMYNKTDLKNKIHTIEHRLLMLE